MTYKKLPVFTIRKIKDNADGSALCEFSFEEDFGRLYLRKTGKKRITKKGVGNWILYLLEKHINESRKSNKGGERAPKTL